MNFFFFNEKFYLKKNNTLRLHSKGKSCKSSGLQACNFKHRCFPVNIPKVLETIFFFRTTPVVAFQLYFSIRKTF